MKQAILTTMVGLILVGLVAPTAAQDAEGQRVAVPLTDPSRPVTLGISLFAGGIEVEGYDGQEVIVETRPHPMRQKKSETVDGMRRIPNTSLGLSIEESRNRVEISADFSSRGTDIHVRVPYNTSAQISSVNAGEIVVKGLTGEMELENTNGGIRALDITGSVVANTTNGTVQVTFVQINGDKAMSFSTLNGNVDISFPDGLRADLRINAGRGDILTDFDADVQPTIPVIDQQEGSGYRVQLEREVHVKVGGGGPTYRFKTFNGNIYIRKSQ